MNETAKRIITVAGNTAPAACRHWKSGRLDFVGTRVPCSAGVVAVLLLSFIAHAQQPGESFRDCPHCPEMVMLPAGEFMMGSPESEAGRWSSEGPLHKVTIPLPFAVGKYEVTVKEYEAFDADAIRRIHVIRELRSKENRGYDGKHPMINIGWHEAKKYAAWLSEETGHTYRLLSESEWEYAARAGTQTVYHWGDDIGVANAQCRSCGSRWAYELSTNGHRWSVQVGSFAANGFGLHDMHGNVWEWVEDCWNWNYKDAPTDGRARLSNGCGSYTIRGGSWNNSSENVRAASRGRQDVRFWRDNIGFRVARTN